MITSIDHCWVFGCRTYVECYWVLVIGCWLGVWRSVETADKAERYGRRKVGPESWPENFCSIYRAKAFSSIEQKFSVTKSWSQKSQNRSPQLLPTFRSNFLSTESQKLGPTFGIPIEQKLIPTFETSTNFLESSLP